MMYVGACRGIALALAVAATAAACAPESQPTRVVLMTHSSFAISANVLAAFQAEHGVPIEILRGEDAGSMVNQAILTRDAPIADAMYGVDNTFLSRALEADIFDPYVSPLAADVPGDLKLGTRDTVTPIDYGDVCINYDKGAFLESPPPSDIDQLTDPAHRGQLVVENPATSSPGLAFLLATVSRFGESGAYTWRDYWADLGANDVEVVDDWEAAYYTSFSGGSGEGDRPIVVSYASSPVAEVVFADPPIGAAPTGVITGDCFRQVEYAGVLRCTRAPDLARKLIDFMIAADFQADIPLSMYVFPARPGIQLPAAFLEHAPAVVQPVVFDPAQIARDRDRLVQDWTDLVLR